MGEKKREKRWGNEFFFVILRPNCFCINQNVSYMDNNFENGPTGTAASNKEKGMKIDPQSLEMYRLWEQGVLLGDIADQYGVTRDRARQMVESAKRKIELQQQANFDLPTQLRQCQAELERLKTENEVLRHELTRLLGSSAADALCAENAAKDRPIDWNNLGGRARLALKTLGVNTVGELARLKRADFGKLRNCGKKTVTELREYLSQYGLDFLEVPR